MTKRKKRSKAHFYKDVAHARAGGGGVFFWAHKVIIAIKYLFYGICIHIITSHLCHELCNSRRSLHNYKIVFMKNDYIPSATLLSLLNRLLRLKLRRNGWLFFCIYGC